MEIERAKAVADVARVMVDSAKVEVQFMEATGGVDGSGFFPEKPRAMAPARPGNRQIA